MEDPVNTAEFWEACYETDNDGWDLGGPTPFFQRLASEIPKGKICVIGGGRGYDAGTFAKAGFEVTAIDFAEAAVLEARENARMANVSLKVLRENVFAYYVHITCKMNNQLRALYLLLVDKGHFIQSPWLLKLFEN